MINWFFPKNGPGPKQGLDGAFGDGKQGFVNSVFSSVADRYDLMNDILSGGMHRLWKNEMVDWLAPPKSNVPFHLLDVAGGTGDIALRFLNASGTNAHAVLCDINVDMLRGAQARVDNHWGARQLALAAGNAETLPFPDKRFDAYTIAFGIRNVPDIAQALREAYRTLKIGGRFLCLEFSEVQMPILDRVYEAYSYGAIPAIGEVVTGDREAYAYLVESIRRFPNQERFTEMIKDAGFSRVTYRNLSGGIAALHSGWRL